MFSKLSTSAHLAILLFLSFFPGSHQAQIPAPVDGEPPSYTHAVTSGVAMESDQDHAPSHNRAATNEMGDSTQEE